MEELRRSGEVQASHTLGREAFQWIREHPLDFAALTMKRAAYFWMPPIHEEDVAIERRAGGAGRMAHPVRRDRGRRTRQPRGAGLRLRPQLIVWVAILAYTGIFMLCYVSFRYRLGIEPLLCLLAAAAAERLWTLWRKSRSASPLGARRGPGAA